MSSRLQFALLFIGVSFAAAIATAPGCGSSDQASQFDGGADASSGDVGQGDTIPPDDVRLSESGFNGPYSDFPATPIVDAPDGGAAAPGNSGTLFGSPLQGAQSGGPCLIEPEVGSLYPHNWLRPRFRWIAAGGENLFELRIHAANQTNDLVVYTAQPTWTMPKAMWDALRNDSADVAMTVAVRGGVYASGALTGEALGSAGAIGIAPVDAPGTIVYWTTSGGSSLKGFSIGDETVGVVMTPPDVKEYSASCIGCHTSTPDGKYAAFTTQGPWANAIGSVEQGLTGNTPPFLGAGGKAALEQAPRGIGTFSPAHWATGDHIAVTTYNDQDIGWIDLEATSLATATGVLARTGDPRHGGAPTWSHDGKTITYVSTDAITTGRLDKGDADLYAIPYANKAGGTATPISGASDPSFEEYYPVYSPDDKWLAFDRIPSGTNMYNAPPAEVFIIPSGGGAATRLAANDPPACTSKTSPGVTNSWPKWAPSVATAGTRTFYWVVFSSTRAPAGNPQLYVSPVVVDGAKITTYRALYFWNQPEDENNHTPAWDVFKIPPPPPPK